MKFILKNKKVTFVKKDFYYLDDKKIIPKHILLKPATLTTEFAYLTVVADKIYHLKSESWLKKQSDKENDREIVGDLNASMDIFEPIVLDDPMEAVLPNSIGNCELYYHDNHFYSPEVNFDYALNNIEVIFLERLTSYTRTFDVTIVEKNLKRVCFTCIDRKKYKQKIHSIFVNHKIVETGPDPVCWTDAIRDFKNGVSWDNIYHIDTEEDDSEEWQPGETDEEDEEDDYEEDEEEAFIPESKRRKLDKEWSEKCMLESNEDYDKWENHTLVTNEA